jgi:transcriptional accessory protein Tex/SPT6
MPTRAAPPPGSSRPGWRPSPTRWAGARDIVADVVADTPAVRAFVRKLYGDVGEVVAEVVAGKDAEPTKFEQYYAHRERAKQIPSHRFLAIRRGEAEGVLRAQIVVDGAKVTAGIERLVKVTDGSPLADQLRLAVADAVRRLLAPSMENDLRAELKQRADQEAVEVFAQNLRNLIAEGTWSSARPAPRSTRRRARRKELPELDVSLRGAVSIARRLQDPLAELVKIEPKAIGVGQYQHDVNQPAAHEALDAVVEDCVNRVGVDLNTASPALLRVSPACRRRWPRTSCAPRRERRVRPAQGAAEGPRPRPEGVRAVRGLPAHPRRREPARRLGAVHPEAYRWSSSASWRRPADVEGS